MRFPPPGKTGFHRSVESTQLLLAGAKGSPYLLAACVQLITYPVLLNLTDGVAHHCVITAHW